VEVDKSYQSNSSLVGMHLGYYRNQNRSSTLINTVNQLVKHNVNDWQETGSSLRSENIGIQTIPVKETKIRGLGSALLVWQWYWVDGKFVANSYQGKFWQAKQKLLMHGDDGAVLIFYAPYEENPETARATMRQFLSTNLAGLESSLVLSKKP
jgi:EpsI family protein